MSRLRLSLEHAELEFSVEIEFVGSWQDARRIAEHLAKRLDAKLLNVVEVQEDDLK